jgi:hypothetical protein
MAKPKIFHHGPEFKLPKSGIQVMSDLAGTRKRAGEILLTIAGGNQRNTKGGLLLKRKSFLTTRSDYTRELTAKDHLPYMVSFWNDGSFLLWVQEGQSARVLPLVFFLNFGFKHVHGLKSDQTKKDLKENGPLMVVGYMHTNPSGYLFPNPGNTADENRLSAQWVSDLHDLAHRLFIQCKNTTFWTKSTQRPKADTPLVPHLIYNFDAGFSIELSKWIAKETQKIALKCRRERFRVVLSSGHINKKGEFEDAKLFVSELPQSEVNKLNKRLQKHYDKDTFGPWHTRFVHDGQGQQQHTLITFQIDMSTLSAHQLMELHR